MSITNILPPERVNTIWELGSQENSYLSIPNFPDEVSRDMRLIASLESNYDTHPIFSVFISPENFNTKRDTWEAAKTEAEAIYREAHKMIELRRQHDEKMAQLREERIAEISTLFPPVVMELKSTVFPSYAVTDFTDVHGNAGHMLITFAPYDREYGNGSSFRSMSIISYEPDVVTRDSDIYYEGLEDALNNQLKYLQKATAMYLLLMEEQDAYHKNVTLPWQEPFVPDNYL